MLIYILHNNRFFTFRLPKNVSGNYVLFDYDNKDFKRSLINVFPNNNKWFIRSNEDIQISFEGQDVESIELIEYKYYKLNVYKTEIVYLYVCPACESNYIVKSVNKDCSLTIGSGSGLDVIYVSNGINQKQLELNYSNGVWSFKNLVTNIPVYVDKMRANSGKLSNLDSIFVMGLKIVICGKSLFFNAPANNIEFYGDKLLPEQAYLATANREINNEIYKDFYEVNEYFTKSPIFRKKINALDLTITSPVDKDHSEESSIIMEIVPSALMSLTSLLSGYFSIKNYRSGTTDNESLITSLVMCAVMLFVSIVWPFVERLASKLRRFINERRRVFVYNRYLKNKRQLLEETRNDQKVTLEFNNVSLEQCTEIIKNRSAALFSRGIDQDDFLNVRLGKGKVLLKTNIDYVKPDFLQYKDKLIDKIDQLLDEYKYIDDAPFSFSLGKERSLAIIYNGFNYAKYMNAILLQILTFHDYASLKLVILTSDVSPYLQKLKNLNHCWDNEKSMRFYATNMHEAENLSSYLVRIYNQRLNNKTASDEGQKTLKTPFYLIVSDNIDEYRNLKIVTNILDSENDLGFGILMFGSRITDIPDNCDNFIDYMESDATMFKSEMEEKNIHKFVPEYLDDSIDFNYYVKLLGNIPIQIALEKQGALPEKLSFLEMYGVGKIEQLNAISRWKNSNIITSLSAPIGVDSTGNILSLDLHEKKHGPHGLIAGMTGSGKSEFIITYILSLAVSYSPSEVQFVLIDYKGGGLAGAFENRKTGVKLPHLVGTITNLDKSSMNRTLVSIQSELQRRQKIFNEAKEQLNTGTIDIYKYQKLVREGSLDKPLSHLFIICDEFAELKANQPDFMDQLVSAARIGRSLGIHLILATQKPSGVVDEQIWSNSKFKVCCKVQTADDSNEMIRRPDAAYIKESGRFYLQVGYDEIFVKGQSAYTGSQYVPSETINVNVDNSIDFIDDLGNVIRSATINKKNETENANLGEELGNVLNYLINCAQEIGFTNQQLWLDNIADKIYLEDIKKKYPVKLMKGIIKPIIGEYDDPANQIQGPVPIDITNKGNLYITGISGSGKTTLLSTIIYSTITTHNTEEVNFYIVDLLSGTLKLFANAPQVGDFMTVADNDRIKKLFYFLNKEVEKRKKYFSNIGGTFATNISKNKAPFPNIIVIVNGIDIFKDQFDELYSEVFTTLTRDSSRVGIYFIITGIGSSSLSINIESNFPQKIAMRYLDTSEYSMIFSKFNGIIPSSNPGRGLIELDNVYEFQTALICSDLYMEKNITYVMEQLNQYLTKAPGVPIMPKIVSVSNILYDNVTLNAVPIGIENSSNCVYTFDFSSFINTCFYENSKMAAAFIISVVKILMSIANTKTVLLNANDEISEVEGIKMYNSNFIKVVQALITNIKSKKEADNNTDTYIFVISDYRKINNHLLKQKEEDESVLTLDDLIATASGSKMFKFIIIDGFANLNVDDYGWADFFDSTNGILLGIDPDDQNIYELEDTYVSVHINKDTALAVRNTRKDFIKFVRKWE